MLTADFTILFVDLLIWPFTRRRFSIDQKIIQDQQRYSTIIMETYKGLLGCLSRGRSQLKIAHESGGKQAVAASVCFAVLCNMCMFSCFGWVFSINKKEHPIIRTRVVFLHKQEPIYKEPLYHRHHHRYRPETYNTSTFNTVKRRCDDLTREERGAPPHVVSQSPSCLHYCWL